MFARSHSAGCMRLAKACGQDTHGLRLCLLAAACLPPTPPHDLSPPVLVLSEDHHLLVGIALPELSLLPIASKPFPVSSLYLKHGSQIVEGERTRESGECGRGAQTKDITPPDPTGKKRNSKRCYREKITKPGRAAWRKLRSVADFTLDDVLFDLGNIVELRNGLDASLDGGRGLLLEIKQDAKGCDKNTYFLFAWLYHRNDMPSDRSGMFWDGKNWYVSNHLEVREANEFSRVCDSTLDYDSVFKSRILDTTKHRKLDWHPFGDPKTCKIAKRWERTAKLIVDPKVPGSGDCAPVDSTDEEGESSDTEEEDEE
ncbi:hypothetical protein BDV95DRAFT_598004 [Massariosphaeria phaeospora]|uniref:BAH domain-containing protein n=1 Tax=Massariosphaeria phaeospora TaxID=100035 RepID=A0A7C8M1P9_9PLEO|nr:hypothetical protein BDV95DRAFT_598004 [Massariosphaeria phaeospora]